jgi:hypothetical protein
MAQNDAPDIVLDIMQLLGTCSQIVNYLSTRCSHNDGRSPGPPEWSDLDLDTSDIILDITQLWGIYTQKTNIYLSKVPMTMDDLQDLQNAPISIWTMPVADTHRRRARSALRNRRPPLRGFPQALTGYTSQTSRRTRSRKS